MYQLWQPHYLEFTPSDLLYRLNCHVDKQPVVGICSLLDSGLLETAVEVSKSHRKSIKNNTARKYHFIQMHSIIHRDEEMKFISKKPRP